MTDIENLAMKTAEKIRAELVCCDIYDKDQGTDRAGRTHGICFWGEAAARIVETQAGLREPEDD